MGREGQSADDAAATLSHFVILQLLVCEEQLAHRNHHTQFTVVPEKQPLLCSGLNSAAPNPPPHLHQPPPPAPTAAKGRDPTQNLEAGSQWLFLFCTTITEHQIYTLVWISGSWGRVRAVHLGADLNSCFWSAPLP